jgi:FkbM family methyltransferase
MKPRRRLLRYIGQNLPARCSDWLAIRSKKLRHLARPGNDLIFPRYDRDLTVVVDPVYAIELAMLSGVYDHSATRVIDRLFQKDWVSVDVGANVGALTLLMAKRSPGGKVFAVEPGPKLVSRLEKNRSLNPTVARVITVCQVGLSDKAGTLFWSEDPNNLGNASLLESHGLSVPVVTLDQFAVENRVSRLDFVKIDVEGMELEVIQGGMQTITKLQPLIYYETLEEFRRVRGFDIYGQIWSLLVPQGYKHYAVHKSGRLTALNSMDQLHSMNVLAVPARYTEIIRLAFNVNPD